MSKLENGLYPFKDFLNLIGMSYQDYFNLNLIPYPIYFVNILSNNTIKVLIRTNPLIKNCCR